MLAADLASSANGSAGEHSLRKGTSAEATDLPRRPGRRGCRGVSLLGPQDSRLIRVYSALSGLESVGCMALGCGWMGLARNLDSRNPLLRDRVAHLARPRPVWLPDWERSR